MCLLILIMFNGKIRNQNNNYNDYGLNFVYISTMQQKVNL